MTAALLLALALAVSAFAALSLRLPSPLTTLLAAYLALVSQVGLVTWALSPFDAVTRGGLLAAETLLLLAAAGAWRARGRPRPSLDGVRAAWTAVAADPVALAFLAVAGAALSYELVLALTVPPNNYDSLTYHLPRVAAWLQDGGIHWIANAPTARMNEFQPLAEQQNLFLFVAAGSDALYALPQYVAQLAILLAVYGAARRLGFGAPASVCSAALLATFGVFALQSTTAQNDLAAAAMPAVAACLLLSRGRTETVLAGVALGLGAAVKLTTVLTWPAVLAWLAWLGGRGRATVRVLAGAAGAFVAVGMWGFVLNLAHTGHPLGDGQGRVDQTVSPSLVTDAHTFVRLVYRTLDLSVLQDWELWTLAAIGVAAGLAAALLVHRRADATAATVAGVAVAVPLVVPALILAVAPAFAWLTDAIGIPARGPRGFGDNRTANEDYSAFGPIGALVLIGVPLLVLVARRRDRRQLALALALPTYVALLGLYAAYNVFLTRFLAVPAALTAPLFAHLFRWRPASVALLAVATLVVASTLVANSSKPLTGSGPVPWRYDQQEALRQSPAETTGRRAAAALAGYERLVPPDACVGAVLDPDDWSYPLWGPRLERRVEFLPSLAALTTAVEQGISYVVVSRGANAPVADQFTDAGWRGIPLGLYWTLVVAPDPRPGCNA